MALTMTTPSTRSHQWEPRLRLLDWGVISLTSFDGHCVRIDFPNREEAEEMFELLEALRARASTPPEGHNGE
jgi:hypothetical protein